jgi:hypothetical protein
MSAGQAAIFWPSSNRTVAGLAGTISDGHALCATAIGAIEAKVGRIGDADVARAADIGLPDVAASGGTGRRTADRSDPAAPRRILAGQGRKRRGVRR